MEPPGIDPGPPALHAGASTKLAWTPGRATLAPKHVYRNEIAGMGDYDTPTLRLTDERSASELHPRLLMQI